MKFDLYYNTTHDNNQKEMFLLEIEKYKKDKQKYSFISDNIYAECEILSYKFTIDKMFIVEIDIIFEDYGIVETKFEEKLNIIRQYFPKYKKLIKNKL